MKTCVCGADMSAMHYRRKYCSRACQVKATRNRARDSYEQTFVGLDGEGINLPDGSHRYVMLSVGDETLYRNGETLDHNDCLEFVYQHFTENPDTHAAYIGFYLGYDFTNWFRSISLHEAKMLFTSQGVAARKRKNSPMPFPVYLGERWEVDLLGMKRLRFRPHVHNAKRVTKCGCGAVVNNPPAKNPMRWCYVCDVGAFFQASFVSVINPDGWPGEAPATAAEFATIVSGKSKRSAYVTLENQSWVQPMMEYNRLENRLLAEVMRIYTGGFTSLGVKLNRTNFYGPGQAAQQWLNQQTKQNPQIRITRDEILDIVPLEILDYWRQSYYGGRFELFYHGIVPGVSHEYDIQSAYPDAIRNLPCLCRPSWGEVTTVSNSDPLALGFYTVFASQASVGPVPHRSRKGVISYPMVSVGWYRVKEIQAGIAAGLVDETRTFAERFITLQRSCDHPPPLANLAGLFKQRLAVGKATPQGKALKLIYNSVYGKMAQSIGEPKYANPIYASIITSDCRIKLLEAIGSHPTGLDDLVMCATDGIYFKSRHPFMPTKTTNIEQLGAWEAAEKVRLTLMKPGVYWDDAARDAISKGKAAKLKSRGISAQALQENLLAIDEAFCTVTRHETDTLPQISITTPFSITSPRLALARGKWETCATVTRDSTRHDSATVAPKRQHPHIIGDGLIRSASPTVSPPDTTPYDKTLGLPTHDDGYTPDGPTETVWVGTLQDLTL